MAAVTIHTDFKAQEEEICQCFHLFPFYLPWSDGTGCHDLSFLLTLSFKTVFSLFFTLIKWFFSSSSLSAIRVVSSAHLRLLVFLWAILIPDCNSSSLASCMTCSAYKLNKQPCRTPFSILNQSVVPYRVLTVASWPTHRFLRRQARWSGSTFSLRVFHSLLWFTQSRLQCSQWSRSRCFSGIPLLSLWSSEFWQFHLWFLCLF